MNNEAKKERNADIGMMMPGGRRPGGPRGPMVAEKPKNFKKTVSKLLGYIGKNKILLIIMVICVIASAAVTLIAPTMQTEALNYLTPESMGGKMTTSNGKPVIDFDSMIRILVILAVLFVASSLFSYIQSRLSAKLSQTTVKTMRGDLFRRIEKLSIGYTDNHPHGDIMSRMTNDIENISNTISQSVTSLISSVITIIGAFCIMLYYSWEMTLISIVTIPLTLLATTFLTKRVRRYFAAQQKLLGELNAEVEESVMGYRTIIAFSREEKIKKEFRETSSALKKTGIKAEIFGGVMGPLMNIINNIGFLLIVTAGVAFAINGRFSVTTVFLFIQFSKQFTRPLNEIANQYTSMR